MLSSSLGTFLENSNTWSIPLPLHLIPWAHPTDTCARHHAQSWDTETSRTVSPEIYYKLLAQAIMEAEEFHDLLAASQKPRNVDGIIVVRIRKPEKYKPQSKDRRPMSQLILLSSVFRSIQAGPQWIG